MSLKPHLLAMANKASTTREALMTIDFRKVIEENKEQFYQDLDQVMQIESVKGKPAKQAPFGKGPKEALLTVMSLAE